MNEDMLSRVKNAFELFVKVSEQQKEKFAGTGLDGPWNLILGCSREILHDMREEQQVEK